jgi:RNA polymerase sigma-70 factor (ECF subfamily)
LACSAVALLHTSRSLVMALPGTRAPSDADASTRSRVAELYRRHAPSAYRLALRYGRGNRQWAEDLVHDVFVEIHRDAERIAAMENPGGWIYRAVTHRCLSRLQRERFLNAPVVRWILRSEPVESDPAVLGHARDELGRVFEAVNALPDKQRLCFWMYHVDGMTQPQIAEILGFRKSYVCKLLKRADEAVRPLRSEAEDG